MNLRLVDDLIKIFLDNLINNVYYYVYTNFNHAVDGLAGQMWIRKVDNYVEHSN